MVLLELFAGSRSVGKEAEALGFKVFSVDINNFEKIDLVIDILKLKREMIPVKPSIIWASPPCTTFSVASIGTHWGENGTPKTNEAVKGLEILSKTLQIIQWFPNAFYFIENPRGMMRKKLTGLDRVTVTYCTYGDKRMKPTDIWSNNIKDIFNPNGWQPRPKCFNGNKKCHHEEAPRSITIKKLKKKGIIKTIGGTQALANAYERSKIPPELCKEILTTVKKQLKNGI